MDFFIRNREPKFNNHYYEESEDFIEKSPLPFVQSFLEYFKAQFRRRSTHVPNLIELGSTLERHWPES